MGRGPGALENTSNEEFVDRPRRQFVEEPRENATRNLGVNPRNRPSPGARSSLRVAWSTSPPAVEMIGPASVVPNLLSNSIEVSNAGWIVRADVFYDPGRGCVPEPATAEDWEIGFIQNVLQDDAVAQYEGTQNTIRMHYGGGRRSPARPQAQSPQPPSAEPPLLDALRNGTGSTQAWFTTEPEILDRSGVVLSRSWTRVRYGAGNLAPFSVSLILRDTPRFSFHQRKLGSNERLLTLDLRTQFQIWIAAKAASASATDLASYHVLAESFPFTFTMSIRGDWTVNPPRFNATQNGRIQFSAQQCRGRILRVNGPTANELLGGRMGTAGIGPRWRDRPEQTRGQAQGL